MESQHWGAAHGLYSMDSATAGGAPPSYYGNISSPQPHPSTDYSSGLLPKPVPHSRYHVGGPWPRPFVHAWLMFAKDLQLSIENVQTNYQTDSTLSPSIDQYRAIAMLKDIPHDQVLDAVYGHAEEDLDCGRRSTATTCRSSTTSSIWTKRSSTRPSSTASSTSNRFLPDIPEKEKRTSKRLRNNTISDLPEVPEANTSSPAEAQEVEPACIYKCTRCDKSFRSMQTWSRHEKEDHEDISFPCMPEGAIEFTIHGRQCALCGQTPTEEHLSRHNIDHCTQSKNVFKRGYELRKHLETHGFAKKSRQSDVLLQKWQRVPADFHKHVAVEHYERGETREWDHTKVILGLLSQEHIAASWERLLAATFKVEALRAGLSCKWSKSRITTLQTRLELGQEPPEVLAEAALDCAKYDRDLLNEASRHRARLSRESSRSHLTDKSGPPVPPKNRLSSPSSHVDRDARPHAVPGPTIPLTPSVFGPLNAPAPSHFDSSHPTDAGHQHVPNHNQLQAILAEVDPARIEAIIRKLASFGTRHTLSSQTSPTRGIGAARNWIAGQMRSFAAASDGPMEVTVPSYIQGVDARILFPVRISNVVATLKGSVDPRSASGVAISMELARIMATRRPAATMVFAAVAGEEQDLYGSNFMAQTYKNASVDVQAMFTNDIVGASTADDGSKDPYTLRIFAQGTPTTESATTASTRATIGGENDSLARELARFVVGVAENKYTQMSIRVVYRLDRFLRGGDHRSFLNAGYAACRFTEPNENFAHQHQNVRVQNGTQYGDLIEFVDFDYVARVAKVNGAALWSLANAPAPPQNVTVDTTVLSNDSQFKWQVSNDGLTVGYEVLWRPTNAPFWTNSIPLGKVNTATINLSKDNVIFGIRAVSKNKYASPAAFPFPR
ncbi:MAG: hypothetical protein Q9203_002159 [Teloschistes exilis]